MVWRYEYYNWTSKHKTGNVIITHRWKLSKDYFYFHSKFAYLIIFLFSLFSITAIFIISISIKNRILFYYFLLFRSLWCLIILFPLRIRIWFSYFELCAEFLAYMFLWNCWRSFLWLYIYFACKYSSVYFSKSSITSILWEEHFLDFYVCKCTRHFFNAFLFISFTMLN